MPSFPGFGRNRSAYNQVAATDGIISNPFEDSTGSYDDDGPAAPLDAVASLEHFEIGEEDDDDENDFDEEIDLENGDEHDYHHHPLHTNRPPPNYYCPLTLNIMEDPVLDGCGHTFDREAIEPWLNYHSICPISRKPLSIDDLVPQPPLQQRIQHWRQLHGQQEEDPDVLLWRPNTAHSNLELMLLPQERRVLTMIKFKQRLRANRQAYVRCIWTITLIITVCFLIVTFLAIYVYDVEIRGPL